MSDQTSGRRAARTLGRQVDEGVEELATKTCPQCGQVLFQDMGVCYGCLYDFSREGMRRVPLLPAPTIDGGMTPEGEDPVQDRAVLADDDGVSASGLAKRMAVVEGPRLALLVQTGDVDLTVPIPDRGLTVGRLPTNDIVLHSRAVSKRHVALVPCGWQVVVQDQGATNPASLKGREVRGGEVMSLGDTLGVCGARLTLVEGGQGRADAS